MAKVKIENDLVIGNVEDKANLKNPIGARLVENFDKTLFELIESVQPKSIHEVGCGEGRLTLKLANLYGCNVRGTEISESLVSALKTHETDRLKFEAKSIYELEEPKDHADLVVCCEVMEHLDDPSRALEVLRSLGARKYIFSVPREPIWRALNMLRLKYLRDFGNTPGHLQHWSSNGFAKFLTSKGFEVERVERPLPWTMVVVR